MKINTFTRFFLCNDQIKLNKIIDSKDGGYLDYANALLHTILEYKSFIFYIWLKFLERPRH